MKYEIAGHKQLHLVSSSKNWQNYWTNKIKPFIGKKTLEIGCGLGTNIKFLIATNKIKYLTSLEPDRDLFNKVKKKFKSTNKIKIINKKLSKLNVNRKFNCLIYADVLEHIKNDKKELIQASKFLKKNGRIIILSPAYNFLYSSFDKNVGHYRRYNKKMIKNIKPKNLSIEKCYYLDSIGFFLNLINKIFLKRNPKKNDFFIWNNFIIPLSVIFDFIFAYKFGRSIICIYKKINY